MKLDTSTQNISSQHNPYLLNKAQPNQEKPKENIEATIQKSAVSVQLSMNAQIVLFSMDSEKLSKGNSLLQGSISKDSSQVLDFLAGKTTIDGLSLKNIGYEGKPITKLSQDEASELVGENGFFGITQTSNRVADFVLSFSQDDVDILKQGREGIVKGFEEAEKLFGGELPEISYKTQERTLKLIDEKIASLENDN